MRTSRIAELDVMLLGLDDPLGFDVGSMGNCAVKLRVFGFRAPGQDFSLECYC